MSVRIIVTGSRDWTDDGAVEDVLYRWITRLGRLPRDPGVTIVHGGQRGADTCADMVARRCGWTPETHPADWAAHGRKAGPLRNQRMADLGADLCLAFPLPGSVGTWDMIRRATAAGIPVHIHPRRTP